MRRFALLGVSLVCGLFPWSSKAEVDHTISLSVVQVRAYPGPGKVFFGSGVVVGPNQVVTNCHVTRTALNIMVSKGAMAYPAVSQQADTRHDLCLLNTSSLPFPTAHLGKTEQLSVGQPLYFYGYPHGIGLSSSKGNILALYPFEGSRIIETSADFTFGASGGGFFDNDGRLVGLATFLSAGRGKYYAIPSDWILSLNSREARKIEPLQGLTFWEDTATLPAFLRPPGG
jgi:S1-C subfamily serine protease